MKKTGLPVFTPGEIRHFPELIDIGTPARLGHLVYTLVGAEAEAMPSCMMIPVICDPEDRGEPATCPGYLTIPGWEYAHPAMVDLGRVAFPEARSFVILLKRTPDAEEGRVMEDSRFNKMDETFKALGEKEGIYKGGPNASRIFAVGVVGDEDGETGVWLYPFDTFLPFNDPQITRLDRDHEARLGPSLSGVLSLERLIAKVGRA